MNRRKQTAKDLVLDPGVGNAAELAYTEMIAELEEKLSQAKAPQMAISGERKRISLSAHMGR